VSTREDLVGAARELFWERGYGATSPREILDAAGAGKGSMYHHFRGKEALAQVAIERNAEEMKAQIASDLASGDNAVAAVRAYLRRERVVLKGCQFGRLVQEPQVIDAPVLRGEIEEMFAWVRGQLAAVISRGIDRGEFRRDVDPVRTAAAVAATLQGAYVLARAAQDVSVFDDAIGGILALLEGARA
jgi:AcrR family transcriptional regulator